MTMMMMILHPWGIFCKATNLHTNTFRLLWLLYVRVYECVYACTVFTSSWMVNIVLRQTFADQFKDWKLKSVQIVYHPHHANNIICWISITRHNAHRFSNYKIPFSSHFYEWKWYTFYRFLVFSYRSTHNLISFEKSSIGFFDRCLLQLIPISSSGISW